MANPGADGASPGDVLRAARIEAGLTLEQLAKMAGTTPSYLSRVERDKRRPSRWWLANLARVLREATGKGVAA